MSYTVECITEMLTKKHRIIDQTNNTTSVYVVGLTKNAVCNVNGILLSSFSGAEPLDPKDTVDKAMEKQNIQTLSRWKSAHVLIFEDCAKLDPNLFDLMEKFARRARMNDLIFGGIQVIFSGYFAPMSQIEDDIQSNKLPLFACDAWKCTIESRLLFLHVAIRSQIVANDKSTGFSLIY